MLKETWNTFLQDNPSEKEVRAFFLSRIMDDFEVAEEVHGSHMMSGRTQRLDAVITLKGTNTSFGIEFKRLETARQPVQVLSQVSAYVNTHWRGFGRLPVFIVPDPFDPEVIAPIEWADEAHTAAFRLIDTIMIGGVRFSNKAGVSLVGRGGNAWTTNYGLSDYGTQISQPKFNENLTTPIGTFDPPRLIHAHRPGGGCTVHRYRVYATHKDGKRVDKYEITAPTREKLLERMREELVA